MAKTVDELVLKTTVEGSANLDQLNAKLAGIEQSSNKTAASTNALRYQFGVAAMQIQDMAVQLEMGTNWMRVMGQQLPQLLGAFGPVGAIIGAVAGVGLPLLSVGLKMAGVDMRNLTEITNSLETSVKKYQEAQKQNMPTTEALRYQFGSLAVEAKRFYDIQETLTKSKASFDLNAGFKELNKTIETAGQTSSNFRDTQFGAVAQFIPLFDILAQGYHAVEGALTRLNLGLKPDQVKFIANELKNIDKNKPEETAKTFATILEYLQKTGGATKEFQNFWDKTVQPIIDINNQLLEMQRNMKASAQQASDFAASLTVIQNSFVPDINAAKRNFDQISAIRKEGALKLAEFNAQITQKEQQDGVNRWKERASMERRISQETADKIKDVQKAQYEAFYASELTNESKKRALDLEGNIIKLQDSKRYFLAYEVQYEEDLAKNRKEQKDTLGSIAEQLRKNTITVDQALTLEQEAYDIRRRADENAERTRQKRKNDAADQQQAVLFEADAKQRVIEYDLAALRIRQQLRNGYPEDIDLQVNIAKLKNDQFEAEAKINREMELGKISRDDALQRISKSKEEMQKAIDLERERNKEAARYRTATAREGAEDAVAKILRDQLTSYQKAGKMVEAVYNDMNSAIDNFVETGKFKFSDFASSVVKDLIKIQLKADMTNILAAGLGIFGIKLPGRAAGGPVSSNSPYLVGEKGPELFIPNASGSIVPNFALAGAGGGTNMVTYNINAVDASSFKQLVARDPAFMYAVTEQGRRSIPQTRR